MKNFPLILALVGLSGLAALAGCDQRSSGAAAGAPPTLDHLLGPLPGPAEAPLPDRGPYAQDRVAIREGRDLFVNYNCYGCHGGRGGGGMGPSLRDVVWLYGGTDADVFSSIAQGRPNGMPAWGPMLPADQIWKITAYIGSMRTELEPKRPR